MKKVSIIVPVYNVGMHLRMCLDSLISQTLKDIEIIVVNDASADNSLEILKEYKNNYPDLFVLIDLEKNSGPGGARNNGIKAASGEFLGFIDSDDKCAPEMYSKLYEKSIEESADVVDCDYYYCKDDNMELCISNREEEIGTMNTEKKKLFIQHTGRMVTKIIRRTIFTENNLLFTENVLYEDIELAPFLASFVKKLAKVNEPLYYYYYYPVSVTHDHSGRFFDRLITSKYLKKRFLESGIYETYKDEVDSKLIELYYMNTLMACFTHFNPPRIDKMYEIRAGIKELVKNYKKNKYYPSFRYPGRISMTLNDISPRLLLFIWSFRSIIKLFYGKHKKTVI